MDRAGTTGGRTDTNLSRELCVTHRFERGHLLVPGLNELRFVVGASPRRQQTVDAVAGITENLLDAPLPEPPQQDVADSFWHVVPSRPRSRRQRTRCRR